MNASQREVIDQLLEFLPIFQDTEFIPATWPERFYVDEAGKKIMNLPYPDYHPKVEEFRDCYRALTTDIHPYEPLPEDETQAGIPFSVTGATFTEEYFAQATLNQVRRYLMLLGRGERFCDGHIDGEFKTGKVVMALRRLAVLRDETSWNPQGMFKKLFGKKEKKRTAVLLAFICLEKNDPLEWDRIADALRQNGVDFTLDSSEAVSTFTCNGNNIQVGHMPMPIPGDEVINQIPYSRFWAQGSPTEHQSHLVIFGAVESMEEVSQIARAISLTHSTRAWYVGNASHILLPNLAADLVEGGTALAVWVNVVISQNARGGLDASTIGLESLGHLEFEIIGASPTGMDLYELLLDLSDYVLQNGPVLLDGQTFGRTEHERMRIEVGRSKLGKAGKVIRLVVP